MEAKVRQYVSQCLICKKSNISKKYGLLPEMDLQCDPWEIIQIDLFGPWSFEDVDKVPHQIQGLSTVDIATRWVELCPYISKRLEDIALLVDQTWFCRYPRPRIVIFDNNSEFSVEYLELLQSYGVTAKSTTIKNPQTNAFVELIYQVIGDSIRAMELHTRKFDNISHNAILQNVAYGLRATYHSSLAASPCQLAFERDMIINATYLANWKDLSAQRRTQILKNNAHENKSRIPHKYSIGDTVYIHYKDPSLLTRYILMEPLLFDAHQLSKNV
jgi:hypothetical protein